MFDEKVYHKEYDAPYYQKNKARRRRQNAERRERTRVFLEEIKSTLECQVCGENAPECLDFHHRNHDEKDFALGDANRKGYGKSRILNEIAKCDILCANCHRKLHASVG